MTISVAGSRRIIARAAFALIVACAPSTGQAPPATDPPPATTTVAVSPTSPSFQDVLRGARLAEYKITYRLNVAGPPGLFLEQIWYVKPPKFRFDSLGTGAGTISTYILEDGAYVCIAVQNTASCQRTSREAALAENLAAAFDLQVRDRPDRFSAGYQGRRQIAGQEADCFDLGLTGAGAAGEYVVCYSRQGILLLIRMSTTAGGLTLEATTFSTSVPDADFRLPAEAR